MSRPPVALTIAGSDPSGGAGIQADLKTFSALGAYGTAVITALTAQNTRGVTGVHVVPADFVAEQLQTLTADVRIDAVKIGMLATAEIADAVGDFLRAFAGDVVVLDPVMVATSGDRLLAPDAAAAVARLVPLASIITPNLHEAADLLGVPVATDLAAVRSQAEALLASGAKRVLLKGGHLANAGDGTARAVDVLAESVGAGVELTELTAPRIATRNTHGTGCTLSSAIAALRPQRGSWPDAVREAKQWLTAALAAADTLAVGGNGRDGDAGPGEGHGPVHHFHALWPTLG
ncbi:MAG: bifunctional hydroxymethylpyrimidine kinase/phosphomethylpyrimidine kinase [Kineosporiaceae bacterium]|nr:bifunctional hydroxymethylpyrimidine kinase/phosphomethylpyrimidine kinase [Kineosporiaceae bacterium]